MFAKSLYATGEREEVTDKLVPVCWIQMNIIDLFAPVDTDENGISLCRRAGLIKDLNWCLDPILEWQ